MANLRSPRLLKKHRRRIIIRSSLIALAFVLLIALPAGLAHVPYWQIKNVDVEGNAAISTENIQSTVTSALAGSYFHLFPRSNILIYPKTTIVDSLQTTYPRIESVSLSMKGVDTILVKISERKPIALWCAGMTASSTDCYFLNNGGLIIDHAPEFSENVYMTYSGPVSGDPLGAQFVNTDDFKKLEDFTDTVKGLSLSPVRISTMQNDDYSLALSGGETILFTLRQPLEETISNLRSVLTDQKLSLRTGNGLSVSSIDLRFGNKVFYSPRKKSQ